jgi:radical SAM protein with 4Fe4S-binding SPASM domain
MEEFYRIGKIAEDKNIPIGTIFELTYNCNLNCRHCYVCKEENREELSYKEIISIIDQLKEAGCLFLIFTGGEPLLRKDFFEIASYAKENNFAIRIFTNGTLISPYIADKIRDINPWRVEISIYGSNPSTHEYITQIPGSWNKTVNGIKYLKEKNVYVLLKCVVMKGNVQEIEQLLKFAQKVSCEIMWDVVISPKDDNSMELLKHRIDEDSLKNFFMKQPLEVISPHPAELCKAGKSTCCISPYGDLYPCRSRLPKIGNLKEFSFHHLWNSSEFLIKLRKLKLSDLIDCPQCEYLNYCHSRCYAHSLQERGNMLLPFLRACQIAKIKKEIYEIREKEVKKYEGKKQ